MSTLRRFRRHLRNTISATPSIYCPLTRLGKNGFRVVTTNTDLVIEGFPRSGNSYVEATFRTSQCPDIQLAHHTHAAANVLRAAQLGKPCYVLIRAPQDACISLVIQEPDVQDLNLALREYARFHSSIASVADQICLVPFEIATKNFNAGVELLNQHYGTRFSLLKDAIKSDTIFEQVDKISRSRNTVKNGVEPYSPNATESVRRARKAEQERLREQLRKPELAKRLANCNAIYHELLPKSGLYDLMQSTAA